VLRLTILGCNALSIVAGFVAAYLWAQAASVRLPPVPGVIGNSSPDDPFNVALRLSAELNKRAARATAVSVLLMAVADGLGYI
jgi:hypothetical protein